MEELLNKDISYLVWKELKENSGMPVYQMKGPTEFVTWPWGQESIIQAKCRKCDPIYVSSNDSQNEIMEKIVKGVAEQIVKEIKGKIFFVPFLMAGIVGYNVSCNHLDNCVVYGVSAVVRFEDNLEYKDIPND